MSDLQLLHAKSPVFYERYERKAELQQQTHYCPGCGHGIAHKLIAEAIADMGLQDRSVFVSPVGCSVFAYYYFDVGNVQAAHGRAPAVATAVKRANPNSIVIGYQGDGDLAAIGTAEIIHAANRGENITIFFINNAIYGMTGGQMAPTTLVGQSSTTSPWGRRPANEGFPLHVSELLATLQAPAYIERVALCDSKNIMRARKAIRKAIELQRDSAGFSFVELLSPCPTIWKLDALAAQRWVAEEMVKNFPLGVFRDHPPQMPAPVEVPQHTIDYLLESDQETAASTTATAKKPDAASNLELKIAGFGGQGVLLLGELFAEIGVRNSLQVSWLPSYGPEMRSGSAHCHVRLATERIGSPLIEHPGVLVAMNELSLRKFGASVATGGTIFYNGSRLPAGLEFPGVVVHCVPAAEIADELGNAKVANVVMLGAVIETLGWLPPHSALDVLESTVKNKNLLELDRRAFEIGRGRMGSAEVHIGATHAE